MNLVSYLFDRHTLNATYLKKSAAYIQALKDKRPAHELRTLHSQLQELYNQLEALKLAAHSPASVRITELADLSNG